MFISSPFRCHRPSARPVHVVPRDSSRSGPSASRLGSRDAPVSSVGRRPDKRAVLRGAYISEWFAASRDDEAGVPTGRSTSGWRLERVGVHASTLKQPRDQGVGVPHIAGVQLVSAPHGGWDGRHQIKDPLRGSEVVRDADRARYRLARIGDGASAPSTDLIAKESEPSGPSCPDRTLGDDATLSSPRVPDRRGLDDESAAGDVDLQSRVEESGSRTMLDEGFERFVDLPIQTDHVAARAQRDPVEVDCSGRRIGCHYLQPTSGHDAMMTVGPGVTSTARHRCGFLTSRTISRSSSTLSFDSYRDVTCLRGNMGCDPRPTERTGVQGRARSRRTTWIGSWKPLGGHPLR